MDTLNIPYEEVLKMHMDDFHERWNNPVTENTPCFNDFTMFDRLIGSGSFSTVKVAIDKKTGTLYALKIMRKRTISQLKCIQSVLNEKRILQAAKFPFIVDLHFTFKDNSFLYLGLQFAGGGDFFNLSMRNIIPEKDFPFYISQITLALEFLHRVGIIYRDLKPENILVAIDGYLKLCDFGYAKVDGLTSTGLVGTPLYIAPEVLRGENHSLAMDWWSLGVLIILCCGRRHPFATSDTQALQDSKERQKKGSYIMPVFFTQNLKDLVQQLLQYEPVKRISSAGMKVHPWFNGLDWNDVYLKKVTAPIIPKCCDQPVDYRNFDKLGSERTMPAQHNELENQFEDF